MHFCYTETNSRGGKISLALTRQITQKDKFITHQKTAALRNLNEQRLENFHCSQMNIA